MARRLFFVPEVHSGKAELHGDDAKHLTRVLRVECGQVYHLSDNHSLYLAEVTAAHKGLVEFHILEKHAAAPPRVAVTLYAALIKFDAFEWMLEKATELGVGGIVPVLAARSEHGLERAAQKRIERWRKILLESSQQCRRPLLPEISEPMPFREALASGAELRLFCDEDGGTPILDAVRALPASVALLIGPEGGWTPEERAAAASWTRVTLGEHVLRAETAALAALAVLSARVSNLTHTVERA